MWKAFSLAVGDAVAPAERQALLLSLAGTLVLLLALWLGASFLLSVLHLSGISWLDTVIGVLGSLASLFVAWLLFPAMSMLVLRFFLDRIIASIERRHYPGLPPARRIGLRESIGSALRLALIGLVLNLVILPLYLLPVANLFIFYGVNGYLVGREYFESVAFRRLDAAGVRSMWRRYRVRLFLAGLVIAFLLSLPLVNLIAPLIGVAFMLHLFEGLRPHALIGVKPALI
jgi:CysZ protein